MRYGALVFAGALALAACSGDDGDPGPQGPAGPGGSAGPTGPTGPAGEDSFFTDVEQCAGCHAGSLASKHAIAEGDAVEVRLQHWNASGGAVKVDDDNDSATPTVQLPAVSVNSTTHAVTVRFHVTVDGAVRNDFLYKATLIGGGHNEDAYWVYDPAIRAGRRYKLPCGTTVSSTCLETDVNWSFESNGNGNYTATISNFDADPAPGTGFMLNVSAANGPTATVVAFNSPSEHSAVTDESCIRCHGRHIWRGKAHDVTNAQGVGPCVVCHNRITAVETRLTSYIPSNATRPAGETVPPASPAVAGTDGTGLMGIVHGVHNSANMPDGEYAWEWPSNGNDSFFKKGFPGNMHNCRTCHMTDAQLAAVAAAPFSYALCISCHDDFSKFPAALLMSHDDFTPASTCSGTSCHDGDTVSTKHNGLLTERAGLIWNGEDQQVKLAPTIEMEITGVTVNGANLEITWKATNPEADPVATYDPCNQDFANGPVFFGYDGPLTSEGCTNTAGGCDSNMSVLRAYAQADDWVNDNISNPAVTSALSPGQPASSFTLWPAGTTGKTRPAFTTCTDGVATTIVPLDVTTATRGIVALQGKPQVRGPDANKIIWVRAVTPTREFAVATGAAPAAVRRQIVDVKKCNDCHYGTLYQHGGSRVDSIELCVMCHNPASSEQNNRVGMGVTAAEAYDGKPGETYDLRTMVHAVHSAGETKVPLMYYRSNGIYFFGAKDEDGKLIGVQNYPDLENDCVSCVDEEDGPLTYCEVFGSSVPPPDRDGPVKEPIANADGTCGKSAVDATATWRPHRVIEVHYPRALNDCSACHVEPDPGLPDPTQAVAVTVDAGAGPWNNLLDDTLIGATTQSCMTCHQSADPARQFGYDVHVFGQGWIPTRFEAGRQTIIDAATP